MLQESELLDGIELTAVAPAGAETFSALDIEEVMRRARQLHRQHGGIFGYDFDDWALAWAATPEPKVPSGARYRDELRDRGELNPTIKLQTKEDFCESCFAIL